MLQYTQHLIHQEKKLQEQQKGIQSSLAAFLHQEKYVSPGWWMGNALPPGVRVTHRQMAPEGDELTENHLL